MWKTSALAALSTLCGCLSGSPANGDITPTSGTPEPAPRVVLALVLDQFPSTALSYLPYLDEDGLLRRMVREGALVERARLSYATTATGPGHAAIHTGKPPSESGVDSNGFWHHERNAEAPIFSKSESEVFGAVGKTAGPDILLAKTVADVLRAEHGDAKILSISHKDRSAIASGGSGADIAAWYESSLPGFTTSAAYEDALPPWIDRFNQATPTSSAFATWNAEAPSTYKTLFGADDAAGEANWLGLGTTFPHDVATSDRPEKTFLASPHSAKYLLDFAWAAVEEYDVGKDETVDFLCLSISTTDYAGHAFSSHSWEYLDVLTKVDRALGAFVRKLEHHSGAPVRILLTSDHGGPHLPEATKHGGRIVHQNFTESLDSAVDARLGDGDWIAAYVSPFLYLTPEAKARRTEILPILEEFAAASPAIESLIPADLARSWAQTGDARRVAVTRSIAPQRDDIYVLPAPGYFADAERTPDVGKGINHGSPEDHDREVPVFLLGPGVRRMRIPAVTPQEQVAASLSQMLEIPAPNQASPLLPLRQ